MTRTQTPPEGTEPEGTEPEGTEEEFDFDFLDPTDHEAVARFIKDYGLDVFQRVRLAQTGTTYGIE